ncbi:protein of unknown function [Paraburkholderia kururiensis]
MSGALVPDALRKIETRLAAAGGFFCACVSFGARERQKAGHPSCNVTLPRNALAAPVAAFAAATPLVAADSLLNQALGGHVRTHFPAGIQAAFQVAQASRAPAQPCARWRYMKEAVPMCERVCISAPRIDLVARTGPRTGARCPTTTCANHLERVRARSRWPRRLSS